MNLDKLDIKILQILQKNSSKPYVEIAKELGVTDGTIHQRLKKLKKWGVIKRFTVELDHKILGESSIAYIFLNVYPGYIESVSKSISDLENIMEVYEVHTHGDLLAKIRFSSPEDLRDIIINRVRTIEGITSTELIPVYKCWKEENNISIPVARLRAS